ncbi:SCY1-like protein 2 [Babylonia areolata]|uniref:SCY1-like protein 2 n=1 Tax=Babylonia areolata TaxID=304850 RepID=UPI003FCFC082
MEMLNKLKSAVSTVLPGNPLAREFDMFGQVASAGPGLLWKVFAAVKRSTKEEASVFVFERKSVERYSRRDRDTIMEMLRGGVQQLTKLRHPKILAVIHPLEESREALAFATEPVFASLANVLGTMTSLTPVPKELQDFQLYDVEIKHGLLQVTEALGFLHHDAKMIHRNVCPEAIVLTKLGSWKLAGCEFCVHSSDPQSPQPSYPFHEWRGDVVPVSQPHLDFMAPEYVLTMQCGPGSDMFSMGLLIYTIFAQGKPLFECQGELSAYKSNAEELRHVRISSLGAVPEELRDHVKLLLNTEPAVRPDAPQLAKVPFFEDVGCVTLQFMDTLFQRQNMEKSSFFKGLPKVIAKLPKRVNLQRILPALFKEALNPDMVPFLLPNIFLVAQQSTDAEYRVQIFPHLAPLFKLKEPVQVVLLFLQNMNLLLSKTPKSDIQNHVLPMLFRAVEADSAQIQELCLSIIPTFAELIEYPTLKNSMVPRIKKLCLATTLLTVRVNCLLCLGQLMEYMDKWYVLDEVLPFLHKIPSREPAVLMSILGIHKVSFESSKLGMSKDAVSNKVLPFLIPLAMDNNLSLYQFNAFMSLIRDMLTKMETEHRSKLEQLEQMKQEQRTLEISRITDADGDGGSGDMGAERNTTMMGKFLSGFGLSGFMSSSQSQKTGGGNSPSHTAKPVSSPMPAASSSATASPVIPPSKAAPLSLEEKQRLARQQEQQERFKSQTPLVQSSKPPSSSTSSSTAKSSSGPKDLTSTLMQSNMAAMSSMSLASSRTPQSSYTPSMSGSAWPNTTTMGMGGGGGYGMASSPFPMQQQQQRGMGLNPSPSQPVRPDLSAFDSLLESNSKPRMSMNQMSATSNSSMGGGARPAFSQTPGMGGMGMAPMGMGTMGMGGQSMGMGGRPVGMGMGMGGGMMGVGGGGGGMMMGSPAMGMGLVPAGFGAGGGGMMGQVGGMGGAMLTPNPTPTSQTSSSSLDDLLGVHGAERVGLVWIPVSASGGEVLGHGYKAFTAVLSQCV